MNSCKPGPVPRTLCNTLLTRDFFKFCSPCIGAKQLMTVASNLGTTFIASADLHSPTAFTDNENVTLWARIPVATVGYRSSEFAVYQLWKYSLKPKACCICFFSSMLIGWKKVPPFSFLIASLQLPKISLAVCIKFSSTHLISSRV
jgi:hypothetical protein